MKNLIEWVAKHLQALSNLGQFISGVVALLLFALAAWQLNALRKQVKQGQEATGAARESADAARDAIRESARIRADERSPRIVALMEKPTWPPLLDMHRQGMPQANELRLFDGYSLQQGVLANEKQPFIFDGQKNWLLWFRVRGVLINEGSGTARVRLTGEIQFIEGESSFVPDEVISRPSVSGSLTTQTCLLRPGDKALFEWGAGHTLGEWADAHENTNPPNPRGACSLEIYATDTFEQGVMDYIFVEMSGRPIEPVHGALGQWQLTSAPTDNFAVTVYPTVRVYRAEKDGPPTPPWVKEYAKWEAQRRSKTGSSD